jgi:hypothetical protein
MVRSQPGQIVSETLFQTPVSQKEKKKGKKLKHIHINMFMNAHSNIHSQKPYPAFLAIHCQMN